MTHVVPPLLKSLPIVLGYSRKKKQGIEDYGISRCIKEIACGISSRYLKKSGISKGDQEKMAEKMAILHFRTPLGLGLR